MAPKLGDIVFIAPRDALTGQHRVEPAIVTATFTIADGDWTQDGQVVELHSFGSVGVPDTFEQQGPAEYDDDGVWITGYATSPDGPEVESLANAKPTVAETQLPTTQASGVSASQVQGMIAANNDTLLSAIQGLLAGQDDKAEPVEPAPVEPAPVEGETSVA